MWALYLKHRQIETLLQGVSLPATQTAPNYALLTIVYGSLLLAKRQRPQNGMGGYVAVAVLEVEANFLVVHSQLLTAPSLTNTIGQWPLILAGE